MDEDAALIPYRWRALLYRVVLAVSGLVAVYGLATGEQLAAWVALAVALIGDVTAVRHTER